MTPLITSNITLNGTVNITDDGMQLLSDEAYFVIAIYLVILGILAFITNSFVTVVLLNGKTFYHEIHNRLLLNISVSDLLLSLVAFPMFASSSFAKHWLFSDRGCTFAGFWIFCLAQNDMNTHAAIAICRYLIVCKPGYEYYLRKASTTVLVLAVVWGHTLFFTSAPLFGWNRYTQEAFGTSCTIDWVDTSPSSLSYNIVITITCYCIHVGIFIFCYYNIIKAFEAASNGIAKIRQESIVDEQTLKLEMTLKYHKTMTYRKVTMASLGMVSAFMIAWTPYAILGVYVMFNHNASAWVLVIPTMFAKSSTVLSPLSCALFSSNFRQAAKRLVNGPRSNNPNDETEMVVLRTNNSTFSRGTYLEMVPVDLTVSGIYIGNNLAITLSHDL